MGEDNQKYFVLFTVRTQKAIVFNLIREGFLAYYSISIKVSLLSK